MLQNVVRVTAERVQAAGLKAAELEVDSLAGLTGSALFEAVFCRQELRKWYEGLEGPLLIEADLALQEVMWETMHDGEEYVALSRGMARVVEAQDRSQAREGEGERLEVVVALASPVLDGRLPSPHDERQPHLLDLDETVNIFAGLKGDEFAACFRIVRHVTPAGLDEELTRGADVLHLMAHGNRGVVALEDRAWRVQRVQARELAAEAANAGARLAVLECCLSAAPEAEGGPGTALAMLRGGVPMVVGMTDEIWVEAATAFTQSLYRLLAQGYDVVQAVRLARRNTEALCRSGGGGSDDWKLPCLYLSKEILSEDWPRLRSEGAEGEVEVTGDVSRWPEPLLAPTDRFVGRREEMVGIAAALHPDAPGIESSEKLLLTGHGGIGKTELALQAADRLRHRFAGGMVCVTGRTEVPELAVKPSGADELLVIGSEREFVLSIGRALGLKLTGEEEDAELVRGIATAANDRQVLLVLDNLEPFGGGKLVVPLLRALGGRCRVLATSRHELPGGEVESVDVTAMVPAEAGQMVREEMLAKRAGVLDVDRVAEACRYTPMAIRLAVGRIADHTQTEREVIRSFEEFTGPAEELATYAFERTLEVATEEARLVFACAAMFVQPPRRDALAAATGLDEDGLGRGIEGAVRLSLVEAMGERDRYELLPLARPVAEGELEKLGDVEERRRRAADECVAFVDAMDDLTRPGRVAEALAEFETAAGENRALEMREVGERALRVGLGQLEEEWASALEFARWAFGAQEWRMVTRLSQALSPFLHLRAMYAERLGLGEIGLEAARKGGYGQAEGIELNNIAIIHRQQGRYEEAMGLYEQSLQIKRELGDRHGEGQTLNNMANIHEQQGRYEEALGLYQQSLEVFQERGDRSGEGRTLTNMAGVHHRQGRYEQAMRLYEQDLAICRELGDRHGEAMSLWGIASVYHVQGQYDKALALYEESRDTLRELGDRRGEGQALNNMGEVHRQQGRYEEAMGLYEQSLELCRELGDRSGEGVTLHNMAIIHAQEGRPDEALALWEQELAICRELGDRHGEGQTLMNMGILAKKTGDLEKAREHWEEALKALEGLAVPQEEKVRAWLEELGNGE